MDIRYLYRKYRKLLLTAMVVAVVFSALGGLVYADLSEDISIFYTPGRDGTGEATRLSTVVTIAPKGTEPPVTLTGDILDTGGSVVTKRGFVWSLTSYPDPGDVAPGYNGYEFWWIEEGTFGEGKFYYQPPDLKAHTDYYGRAFALNSIGWSYGNEVVFDPSPTEGVYTLAAVLPYVFVGICLTGALASAVTGFGVGAVILAAIATIISIVGVGVIQGLLGSIQ